MTWYNNKGKNCGFRGKDWFRAAGRKFLDANYPNATFSHFRIGEFAICDTGSDLLICRMYPAEPETIKDISKEYRDGWKRSRQSVHHRVIRRISVKHVFYNDVLNAIRAEKEAWID